MALSANNSTLDLQHRAETKTFVVKTSSVIYDKALVGVDSNGDLLPWADVAGHRFVGVAVGGSTTGNDAAEPPVRAKVNVSGKRLIGVDVTGVDDRDDIGKPVYCASDDSGGLTLTPSTNVKAIGRLIDFRTTSDMDVELFTPAEYMGQGVTSDITTLTDSTGQSGTHDDTLAATTVPTITATNPAAPTAYSAVVNMTDPVTKAEGEAVSAALATLRGEVATYETAISALVVDVTAILALLTVMTQNQSDTAQKVIEILAQLNKN